MFKAYEMMETAVKHNAQGGEGSPKFRYLFSAEELGNRAELMAVITLEPGESVGVHPHTSNGEAYFIAVKHIFFVYPCGNEHNRHIAVSSDLFTEMSWHTMRIL